MPEPIVAYWEALPIWITLGFAVFAALLVAAAIWWMWWRLPKREAARLALKIRDAKARVDVEDTYRKTIGQALGGIVVLLGAAVAYLQFSQQQRAVHDLLISNQVSKGFEQLGSEKVVIRLGGIYALEGVMNNSDQYHQPVLEALSAFVREGAKLPTTPPPPGPPTQGPPTDIQAALTVIGRRSAGHGIVDLTNANIAGANLRGAILTDANLRGANLTHADLIGADLTHAELSSADLTGAKLYEANLTGATLSHAKLTHAQLFGANLSLANLYGANFSVADLTRANLYGANFSLADLTGATLNEVNLNRAALARTNLTNVTLDRADLTGAQIDQQQLDEACGSDAKLPAGLTLKPCPP
jgi:uncharacterized protein YjbI with pentapeptide repeats